MKQNKIITFWIVVICLSVSINLSAQKKIVILHTNDTHSQIEPIRTGEGRGKGGVHRRGEFFKKVRSENENVLIMDAGDFNQGTPYFTLFKGDMEIEVMNALGYDLVCLGNHEFDNGVDDLARRLSKAKFPIICANYDFSTTPLAPYIKPYVIIEKGGLKIGVFSILSDLKTLVSEPSRKGVKYLNGFKVADEMSAKLKALGCDMVIALTHIGYSSQNPKALSDITLAQKSANIDLIIGGHSHTFLKSERVYKNREGKDVVVVQAGARGEYVGKLEISY